MASRGRPREFDTDAALDQAMCAFWRHGYEGASLRELTEAMGISPTSLYAAFGDKKALFLAAVDRYLATHGAFTVQTLENEPTARRAIARLLEEASEAYSDPSLPGGCLVSLNSAQCTDRYRDIKAALAERRAATEAAMRDRIARGQKAGELRQNADPDALAGFYAAVMAGMSDLARGGAGRQKLERIAALAMQAWPSD